MEESSTIGVIDMNDSPSSRRPLQTAQFVLNEVRRAILTGRLQPGQPIRQDALAQHLGVSRVPIREALKILQGEGHVRYLPRRGYEVAELSLEDLTELYHLRQVLEAEAIRAGIPRMTDADVEKLEQAAEEVERASETDDVIWITESNSRFHFLIFDAAGMPRLSRLLRNLWDTTDAYRVFYYADRDNREQVLSRHREIVEAARARDVELSVFLQDNHRGTAISVLQGIIERSQATAK